MMAVIVVLVLFLVLSLRRLEIVKLARRVTTLLVSNIPEELLQHDVGVREIRKDRAAAWLQVLVLGKKSMRTFVDEVVHSKPHPQRGACIKMPRA